ncbi:MAG: hypothetical protein ISS18_14190 [Bacteroidales bacterium]|nr:hypothetical protein [Bacteroidales bacterium]
MEKKVKKSRLAGIPAWALSLMTLVALIILLSILEDPKNPGYSTIQIIGYTFGVILITVACFIICRTHPKSVWYTPVICNAVGIMAIIMYVFTDLSTLSELIHWVSSCVISVIGAVIGAKIGRRTNNQLK